MYSNTRRGLADSVDRATLLEAAESLKEQCSVAAPSAEKYACLSSGPADISNGDGGSSRGGGDTSMGNGAQVRTSNLPCRSQQSLVSGSAADHGDSSS